MNLADQNLINSSEVLYYLEDIKKNMANSTEGLSSALVFFDYVKSSAMDNLKSEIVSQIKKQEEFIAQIEDLKNTISSKTSAINTDINNAKIEKAEKARIAREEANKKLKEEAVRKESKQASSSQTTPSKSKNINLEY